MTKRRGFLTPDTFEGAAEICRPLSVPLPLLHYVGGALSELTIAANWESFGTMTPQEAAEAFTEILASWQGDCGESGTCEFPADPEFDIDIIIKIIRRGAGGHTEELVDGVWQEPTGDYEVPDVPARTEPLEVDRICLAAANAANVLAQLYEEVTDAIAVELAMASVIGAIYDFAISVIGAWAGPTAVAYASWGKTAFDAFIQSADALGSDVWTNAFTDELICFLYNEASDAAGVVSFDWPTLRSGITAKFAEAAAGLDTDKALLWGQVGYLFEILSAGGIDHAGTTTAIEAYDCTECNIGAWKLVYNFRTGAHGWNIPWTAGGALSAGNGIVGTNYTGTVWGASCWIDGLGLTADHNPQQIRGHLSKNGNAQIWLEDDDVVIWNIVNAVVWNNEPFNAFLSNNTLDKIEFYMNAAANRNFVIHDFEIIGNGQFPPGAIPQ